MTAYRFGKTIKAPNGENGHEKNMYGKYAPDVILPVPVGTVVKDMEGNLLADLSHDEIAVMPILLEKPLSLQRMVPLVKKSNFILK